VSEAQAPTAAPRLRSNLLAWRGYAVSLLLLGQWYWRAPLTSDESDYYWPAIRGCAARLPALCIADYALPNPPLALILQTYIYAASSGSVLATRALTGLFSLLLAAFVLAAPDNRERRGELLLSAAYVLCVPALLNDGFLLKHHVFSVCGLVGAVYCARNGKSALAIGACLGLAVLSSQAAVPFAAYLMLLRGARLAAAMLPLAALFALWGGFEPPSYKSHLLDQHVGALTFNSGQLALGLYVVGLWFLPLAGRFDKRALGRTAVLYPLSALLVHASGGMRETTDLSTTIVGPTITLLRALTRGSYPLLVALFALGVALGAQLVIAELRAKNARGPLPVIALYFAFMNFVPYRFESYYIYLIVPWLVWDRERLLERLHMPRWRTYATCAALVGVTYTLIKLYRLSRYGVG
jgi:hypothetical protein